LAYTTFAAGTPPPLIETYINLGDHVMIREMRTRFFDLYIKRQVLHQEHGAVYAPEYYALRLVAFADIDRAIASTMAHEFQHAVDAALGNPVTEPRGAAARFAFLAGRLF
jgi:hypothetical protein